MSLSELVTKFHEASLFGEEVVQNELSVLALIKGNERFIYVFDDSSREMLINAIRDQAANPGVSLSWFDAAVLTERVRQQAKVGSLSSKQWTK
jgi:hypothetical protein